MIERPVLFATSVFLLISVLTGVHASEWYVDGSVTESGDGTSWETAFKAIQQGIDAASSEDTVTVAQGVHVENINFNSKNIVLASTDPLASDVVAGTIIYMTIKSTYSSSCWRITWATSYADWWYPIASENGR